MHSLSTTIILNELPEYNYYTKRVQLLHLIYPLSTAGVAGSGQWGEAGWCQIQQWRKKWIWCINKILESFYVSNIFRISQDYLHNSLNPITTFT